MKNAVSRIFRRVAPRLVITSFEFRRRVRARQTRLDESSSKETGAKIPSSLAKKCVRSIVQNIGSYKKSLKRKLAPPAREMVLDELTKNAKRIKGLEDEFAFDKVWADLPFLLNSRTKKFRSRWLWDMLDYSVPPRPPQPILRQLLDHLSERAPNLEYLELFFSREDAPLYIGIREMFAIGRMEKLTKIFFCNVSMKLADFRSLTIKCKNLQEISAGIIEIEEMPAFLFEKFPVQIITVSIWQDKCIGMYLGNASSDGAISTGYRCLVLRLGEISRLSFMENLTNMTRLELDCYRLKDEDMLEEFPYSLPSLDTAEIYFSSGNVIRKFLEKNGEKLDDLYIAGMQAEGDMSYSQVFDWCPKLKRLELHDSPLSGNEIRIDCLEHLQYIAISLNFAFEDENGPVLQISSILSAPNLKFVEINVWKFDLGDYRSIIARITKREIFKNLKFLYLSDKDRYAYYIESTDKYEPYFGERERLVELENAIEYSRS